MFVNAATARILGLPGCRELGLIMVLLEVKEKEHKRSNMAEEMNLPLPNPYLRLQTLHLSFQSLDGLLHLTLLK